MVYNDDVYKKRLELLMQKVLKTINIEIMLQYLKPNERKALYCILNDDIISEDYAKYQSIIEFTNYYNKNHEDIAGTYDNAAFINQFTKLKILNYEFINKFPCSIYLDLNDKYQKRIFTYTKILHSCIYSDFLTINYKDLKDYYYNYEKVLTENFFNKLDADNLYFNLILLQGILTEIKEDIITFPSANVSLINSVLLGKVYYMMLEISADKQSFMQDKISEAFTDYIAHTVIEIEEKKNKIIEKIREEGVKSREKLNACEDKIKFLIKNDNDSLLNKLYEDIRKKELEYSDLRNELLKRNEAEAKKIESLNSKMCSITSEKEKLLNKITELEIQNSKLQVKIFEAKKEKSFSDMKEYLDKYTDKLLNQLKKNEVPANLSKHIGPSDTVAPLQPSYRIGYAALTQSGIEIVTPYGKYPVNKIPDQTLIGEGQFIRIDTSNNFIYTYKYYASYEVQFHLHPECKFGEIKKVNDKLFIDFGNNLIQPALRTDVALQKGQLVLADSFGNIKIIFKKLHFILDYFYEINKFRGMELWRVISLLNNMCIIENIDTTRKEIFKSPENHTIKENDILLRKGDAVINVFDFRFYSHSHYYNKAVNGVAEVKDDIVMLTKSNGEKIIVNSCISMSGIETGDIITIDELNNIIKYEKNSLSNNDSSAKKKSLVRTTDKYKVNHVIIKRRILVLGNPTYQQSYKLNFLKNGYQAEVIDGYSSWSRVQKSIKDISIIVVVINYVSHDNMWQIKDNIKDIPVIYSETDGANRIIELIENNYADVEITTDQLDKVL